MVVRIVRRDGTSDDFCQDWATGVKPCSVKWRMKDAAKWLAQMGLGDTHLPVSTEEAVSPYRYTVYDEIGNILVEGVTKEQAIQMCGDDNDNTWA